MKILILGATSRIAEEVARIYAQEKQAEMILAGRNESQLKIIASDLKVRGAKQTDIQPMDFNLLDQHKDFIEKLWSDHSSFDLVYLCYGVLVDQSRSESNPAELHRVLQTNYISPVSLLNLVSGKMKIQGQGSIVVFNSAGSDRGRQSNFIYSSAKAGLSVYCEGLRNRLYPFNINVVNIRLGFVDTPMTAEFKKGLLWSKPDTVAKKIVKAVENRESQIYLPRFWRFIMLILCLIPEFIFKKMKL